MTRSDTFPEKKLDVFLKYFEKKKYQVSKSEKSDYLRLEVSDYTNRTIVNFYNTGTVQVQGKESSLKDEIKKIKEDLEAEPLKVIGKDTEELRSCNQTYDIMLEEKRNNIKESLEQIVAKIKIENNLSQNIEYRAKVTKNGSTLTLTQYSTGTLLLQGKEDNLFHTACDLIEKIAAPEEKQVISRFISYDPEVLDYFTARYTPRMLEIAENNVKEKVGIAFDFLKSYDKKWFVASECLCLSKIPLPEFSALVMPASKAFEGFAKKLCVGIGLVDSKHFKSKKGNFSPLSDTNNKNRQKVCTKDTYADSFLKKLVVSLEFCRNFMMHSDDSRVTKVLSQDEAEKKVDTIFNDTKDIFDYFNVHYNLLTK